MVRGLRLTGAPGQGSAAVADRQRERFRERFTDPAYRAEDTAIAHLERYIGYYRPYASSHEALDADLALQEEVRNVARALVPEMSGLGVARRSECSDISLEVRIADGVRSYGSRKQGRRSNCLAPRCSS